MAGAAVNLGHAADLSKTWRGAEVTEVFAVARNRPPRLIFASGLDRLNTTALKLGGTPQGYPLGYPLGVTLRGYPLGLKTMIFHLFLALQNERLFEGI